MKKGFGPFFCLNLSDPHIAEVIKIIAEVDDFSYR